MSQSPAFGPHLNAEDTDIEYNTLDFFCYKTHGKCINVDK